MVTSSSGCSSGSRIHDVAVMWRGWRRWCLHGLLRVRLASHHAHLHRVLCRLVVDVGMIAMVSAIDDSWLADAVAAHAVEGLNVHGVHGVVGSGSSDVHVHAHVDVAWHRSQGPAGRLHGHRHLLLLLLLLGVGVTVGVGVRVGSHMVVSRGVWRVGQWSGF